ncbi:unnamed protein product [Caenorhabditis auriculariae]|uniref:Ammonium transporter AmtB-like domain-containing protein n=1 Tax=Caenorhabditis auriculariae TaxID=2777116 RepID=A0A8S1GNC1_9PELO|nr:unnamed protein product [Caenorhabditis auriculariae]
MASTPNYTAQIMQLQKEIDQIRADFTDNDNAFFLCSMAIIIFLMQCGFAFLEAGAVRSKNTTNILIKNLLDSCIAIVGYWSLGWAFAYGDASNSTAGLFIGYSQFFLANFTDYPKFFFQYVFAATSATIVSGAVAERCEFVTYIVYCSVISTFVYPILTHWGWHPQGWMLQGITSGIIKTTYLDFAGAGVVHLCGGSISFVAALIMGPRIGKFPKDGEEESDEIKGHSVPFAALGGFILMFGFLAFNGGSMADIVKPGEGYIVALAMVNTILCGAFAALTYLIMHYITHGKWTLLLTINACLAGMVSACAGCNRMEPWGSVFVGTGSGLIYLALSKMMIWFKIDDPLDAFAVHAGGGFWGLISTVIVGHEGIAYAVAHAIGGKDGANNEVAQSFAQLGWQFVCIAAIVTWSWLWMVPIFLFLKKIGKLRVSEEVEINGLDIYKHGESAYPLHAYGHGWHEFEATGHGLPHAKNRGRTLSVNAEMSLEQLAAVYERTSSISHEQEATKRLFAPHNDASRKTSKVRSQNGEHLPNSKKSSSYQVHDSSNMTSTPNYTAQIIQLQNEVIQIRADFTDNENAFFLCSMAMIIFFMQCGFAFLEAGAVRSKNTTNILIKNLLDSCIAIVGYWAFGWALAYGEASNPTVGLFIGHSQFFLANFTNYPKFFFQYVFAATSSTIVSGAVAERCEFITYIVYVTVISTFVYPILTHWGWHPQGWMFLGFSSGSISTTYLDYAGSGMVHLCGGSISLVAAYIMGPRIGKFPKDDEEESDEIKGHSVPFVALGGFILMFGFLAFNGGSQADIVKPGEGDIVALSMVNTFLCGAFASFTYLIIHYITHGKWTLLLTINACLTGMVSACAGCNRMEPWGSFFVGTGAGLIYLALSKLMIRLKIDDPLDAFAVHAGGGFWGLISAVVFAHDGIVYAVFHAFGGQRGAGHELAQSFAQLGWQFVCIIAIITWSCFWLIPIFLFLRKIGKLRVPEQVEVNGLDIFKHGESAYPLHAYGHGWHEFEATTQVVPNAKKKSVRVDTEMSLEHLAAVYERTSSVPYEQETTKRLFDASRKNSRARPQVGEYVTSNPKKSTSYQVYDSNDKDNENGRI